jgi:hypothetical protein
MASAKSFLHFFYGSDSVASSEALRSWSRLFADKYGTGTRYIVEADELTSESLLRQLAALIESRTLFAEPQLIILKRVSALDVGNSQAASRALAAYLAKHTGEFAADLVLLQWEPTDFPANHPLLRAWKEWEGAGKAVLHAASSPTLAHVVPFAQRYLKTWHRQLEPAAARWLQEQYGLYEQHLRLRSGLKKNDPLLRDERTWWLRHILSTAALLSAGEAISKPVLQQATEEMGSLATPFDILRAVEKRNWDEAFRYLKRYGEHLTDSGDWYACAGAFRWFWENEWERRRTPYAQYAMRLLGEMEVAVKNSLGEPGWLMELYLCRLQEYNQSRESRPLLPPRRLWLAGLNR